MVKKGRTVRALGLCSGGLDSMLSGLVLREQGIEVEWVSFETPFFNAAKGGKASKMTGIPLTVKPIFNIYIGMLKNPPAGCRFAPRCRYAMPACRLEIPPLRDVGGGHKVACILEPGNMPQ